MYGRATEFWDVHPWRSRRGDVPPPSSQWSHRGARSPAFELGFARKEQWGSEVTRGQGEEPHRSTLLPEHVNPPWRGLVRLFSKVVGIALDFYGREQGGDRRCGCVNEIERYRIGCSSGV